MTTWHWIRHGPTHEKTFVGWRDVPADLSDTARINRLRSHLPKRALLVSSDLIRASDTAEALRSEDHIHMGQLADLREIHFGLWDGMHFSDVAERDPDLSRAYWETPGDVTAPEGESWNMTAARVNRVVDHMNVQHPTADIIAVAHFGVILTQVQRALGISPYDAMAHKIDNLSTTQIQWSGNTASVALINHCP